MTENCTFDKGHEKEDVERLEQHDELTFAKYLHGEFKHLHYQCDLY